MKVRALKTIETYYSLEQGSEYEVYGIVYFATPYFSHTAPTELDDKELRNFINPVYSYGKIRNELIYIIESVTGTGRRALTRFNASNFEVIDSSLPDDWSTTSIDLCKEVLRVKELFDQHGTSSDPFIQSLEELKSFNATVLVTGKPELHSFEYLHKVCDDSLDS